MNKNRIRLTESQLNRVIKESVKRVLKETTDFMNSDEFYKVDIHEPNSSEDVDNRYFYRKRDAYIYAKKQCFNKQLQADIYYFEDEDGEIESEDDLFYADWNWIDCVGFIDGQINQF